MKKDNDKKTEDSVSVLAVEKKQWIHTASRQMTECVARAL